MSFSIKQIKAILSEHNMPVDDLDKATEEICARHSADLEGIKEERDIYKKDAETLASVQKELDTLKAATSDGKNPYKVKYEAIKEEFEAYKKDVDSKAVKAEKEKAYMELLKETDILIDGPFVLKKRDLELKFRGSSNQRIIDVKRSLEEGKTVICEL